MAIQKQGYDGVARLLKRAGLICGLDRFGRAVASDNAASREVCVTLENFRQGGDSLTNSQWNNLFDLVICILATERDRTGDILPPDNGG